MAIPPFPSQDLAKLVLGYLAEEQLMTAYDEFLQASPYLDAMHNEYDRIFMTSLKSILAEYRAVKIFVETCKPFLLRKKLFQCTNLLEMVKLLVNYIDVNKLQITEDQLSSDKLCTTNLLKYSTCEVCNSLKFSNCVCKTKQNQQKNTNSVSVVYQDETSMVNSVETTSLADLPGSHIKNKKKAVKVLDKGFKVIQSFNNCIPSEQSSQQSSGVISNDDECNSNVQTVQNIQQPFQINLHVDTTKIDENKGVATVCNKIAVRDKKPKKTKHTNKKGSTPTSFQDFAFGVRGGENQNVLAPDSITSENTNAQSCLYNKQCENVSGIPKPQLYLNIEPVRSNSTTQDNEVMNTVNNYPYTKIRPMDPKVKILSDVKVDNAYKSNDRKKKAVTNNATSTPMMKMQTLVINGTPAYRTQIVQSNQTFSRDEIMAMPTIIVVPSSGSQQVISQPQPVTSITASTTATQVNTTNKNLTPLIIDISSPTSDGNDCESNFTKQTAKNVSDVGLVKTVDAVTHLKNSSLPKDTVTTLDETTTPQTIPVTRKSSSTPRRSSHIRVLDFTTPRRILHETINEQAPNENHNSPLEVISGENCNTEICTVNDKTVENNTKKQGESTDDIIFDKQENTIQKKQSNNNGEIVSDKLKETTEKHKFPIKASWDSKLRSLITPNVETYNVMASTSTSSNRNLNNTNDTKDKTTTKKRKPKKIKKQVIDDDEPELIKKTEVVQTIKPTIHIKCGTDRSTPSTFVDKKNSKDNQDKLMEEERINTPEGERLTLQNVMGAKLNISELLETPYKQAFYDIQMETPRCLVPDLPGEPLSDFKIMSIPTPRFFDSPKITSATPSYSSRPTDYSSGGSYYKPDDQDFIPSDLNYMVSSTHEDTKAETIKDNSSNAKKNSRPVRKCAKNVSYYNSFRSKDFDDIINTVSPCSESTSAKSIDSKCEKENLNASKDKPSDINESIPEKKKSSKKQKSLVSKEKKSKTFMKIKPRRVTPVKDTLSGRIRKKTMQSTPAKVQSKRSTSKEKKMSVTPTVACVPTKSRRKSSTPRKLHCNKTLNSSSGNDSTDINKKPNIIQETSSVSPQESDVDQLALRWSDDGSQEVKRLEEQTTNDSEDISKIQEYIEKTVMKPLKENEGVFRNDLIKRGFDIETARIIERDLLDTPPQNDTDRTVVEQPIKSVGTTNNASESSFETVSAIQIDDDSDEIEFSLHECNEETNNFVVFEYHDTKETITRSSVTLKDKFSMEVCIDDDLTIRLRATPFIVLYDFEENNEEKECNAKETEEAVKSILNIDNLYTPLKASVKDQVYNIFDSTLTSLDTPLKDDSPKMVVSEVSVNAIVLEEETNMNEKTVLQKRKRYQSDGSEESLKDNKRAKPDAQYLLSSANIQNIDIETVLKKLHGP